MFRTSLSNVNFNVRTPDRTTIVIFKNVFNRWTFSFVSTLKRWNVICNPFSVQSALSVFISINSESSTSLQCLNKLREILVRELGKPNFHRLNNIGELVLECTNKSLKRGLQNSNNKNTHLQSMSNSIADDWKRSLGRLHEGLRGDSNRSKLDSLRFMGGINMFNNIPEHWTGALANLLFDLIEPKLKVIRSSIKHSRAT